jgi:hypothetical protein
MAAATKCKCEKYTNQKQGYSNLQVLSLVLGDITALLQVNIYLLMQTALILSAHARTEDVRHVS